MSTAVIGPRQDLSAVECIEVADLLNACITNGTPEGVEVRWFSRQDLDATPDDPETVPGVRTFAVLLHPTPSQPYFLDIILAAVDTPDADRITATAAQLLAPVGRIERHLCDVYGVAHDIETLPPMTRLRDRREAAEALNGAVIGGNEECDLLRAIAADPKSWQPIGVRAYLVGGYFAYVPRGEATA